MRTIYNSLIPGRPCEFLLNGAAKILNALVFEYFRRISTNWRRIIPNVVYSTSNDNKHSPIGWIARVYTAAADLTHKSSFVIAFVKPSEYFYSSRI